MRKISTLKTLIKKSKFPVQLSMETKIRLFYPIEFQKFKNSWEQKTLSL